MDQPYEPPDLLAQLRPHLVKEAADVLAAHPEAELAGLLLEAGTAEYKTFRNLIQQATGQELVPTGSAGVIPLNILEKLLEDAPPEIREVFELVRSRELLPVLVCRKIGMRHLSVSTLFDGTSSAIIDA